MDPALGCQRPPVRVGELLDDLVAVHRLLGEQAQDGFADQPAARLEAAPRAVPAIMSAVVPSVVARTPAGSRRGPGRGPRPRPALGPGAVIAQAAKAAHAARTRDFEGEGERAGSCPVTAWSTTAGTVHRVEWTVVWAARSGLALEGSFVHSLGGSCGAWWMC